MNWLDSKVTYYSDHHGTQSKLLTLRQILFWEFTKHLDIIIQLRHLNPNAENYDNEKRRLKNLLACFALNILENRQPVNYSGLISLDFDDVSNIDEVAKALFTLPFIAFVSRSCSGRGLYVIALIGEPEKQREYVNHLFNIFEKNGLKCDTSKGRNYNDLRYVSYDANMLIKESPTHLFIKRFYSPKIEAKPKTPNNIAKVFDSNTGLLKWATEQIKAAQKGQRFETVRRVAYAMGGHGCGLNEIKEAINTYTQFTGVTSKYLKVAEDCFAAGKQKPIAA